MPMVRAMRMLNAIEAGTLSGAQLQTLLTADPGRLAELNVLLGMRGQARRMAASSTAMTAVTGSSTAMTAVIASSTAMTAVIASSTAMTAVTGSSTAMTAVIASSTAMTAVAGSSVAKLAIYNTDTALTSIGSSVTAMGILRDHSSAGTATTSGAGVSSPSSFSGNIPNASKLYLVLSTMTGDASTSATHTVATRRSGSAIANTLTTDASNVSSQGFKYFAAPVPVAATPSVMSSDTSSQVVSVRFINCSDNTVYA